MNAAPLIRKQVVQELRRRQQAGSAEVLRVLEHEEKVHVADEDAYELHDAAAGDDHVEGEQHPREVHGLELGAEPELHDHVLVELAPDVQDGKDQRIHQEWNPHEESHDHAAQPGEQEHESVVRRPSLKYPGFKPEI